MSTICPMNICRQNCHCETGKPKGIKDVDEKNLANVEIGEGKEEPFADFIFSKVFGIPLG